MKKTIICLLISILLTSYAYAMPPIPPSQGLTSSSTTSGTYEAPGPIKVGTTRLLSNGGSSPVLGSGLYSFGDSITYGATTTHPITSLCGVNTSIGAAGGYCYSYAALLSQSIGGQFANFGVSQDQAADTAMLRLYPYTNPGLTRNPIYTLMIGTNDAIYYSTDVDKQAIYNTTLKSLIAWLTIPRTYKLFGQDTAVTKTGTWTNDDTPQTGLGIKSNTNADSLSFTITTTGGPIYIGYKMTDSNRGTASVTIDSVAAGTINCFGAAAILTHTPATTSTIGLFRYPVNSGSHTVVITVTSATDAANIVSIQWAGTPPNPAYYYPGGPNLFVGGILDKENNEVPEDATYDGFVRSAVTQLAADGLNVHYVPTRSYVSNTSSDMIGVHPNNQGHQHLRDAFESIIQPSGYSQANGIQLARVGSTGTSANLSVISGTQYSEAIKLATTNTGTDTTCNTVWKAIKFTPTTSTSMGGVGLRLKKSGTVNNTTAYMITYLYSDNAGVPGTVLASGESGAGVRYDVLTTNYAEYQWTLSYSLVANTAYWLILKQSAAPTGGGSIIIDSLNSGTAMFSGSANGTAWTNVDNVSPYYIIYGSTSNGVYGFSQNNYGVYGYSTNSPGIYGYSLRDNAIKGETVYNNSIMGKSTSGAGVYGVSNSNVGVIGTSTSGYGGYFTSTSAAAIYSNSTSGVNAYFVPKAFSSLPACAAGTEGSIAAITDSATATFGEVITGSSTNHVLGYCDGTNWTVMAK